MKEGSGFRIVMGVVLVVALIAAAAALGWMAYNAGLTRAKNSDNTAGFRNIGGIARCRAAGAVAAGPDPLVGACPGWVTRAGWPHGLSAAWRARWEAAGGGGQAGGCGRM